MSAQGACAGLILAGGASSRMGREKALLPLAGRALLAHVIARFAPQVGPLAISANGDPARFDRFELPVIPDLPGAPAGPLAGILAGLRFAATQGCATLAVVPSDAPFLPLDLVERLAPWRGENEIAAALGPTGVEPLFSLWPVTATAAVEAALAHGQSSVERMIGSAPHRLEPFPPTQPDPFMNVNTPEEAAIAHRLIRQGGAHS